MLVGFDGNDRLKSIKLFHYEDSNLMRMKYKERDAMPAALEQFHGLHQEMILSEILIRLPIKALMKCKLVCKMWNALLLDSNFITSHFIHHNNHKSSTSFFYPNMHCKGGPLSVIFVEEDNQYGLPYQVDHHKLIFLGSSNRLLYGHTNDLPMPKELFICNPITNNLTFIPNPPISAYFPISQALAVDPASKSSRLLSYTMVCPIVTSSNSLTFRFEVFSSTKKLYYLEKEHLAWFDVEDGDKAGTVPCPARGKNNGHNANIGACNGELS
ncbi:hypothetical protein Sjap_009132 [Stephania japonica]|uniref:F-box domain-containing protein n=1 Tax=Stephania japonica TaxID=461633 RepID=A0AAP0JQT7_9MAGN